jgi:hypothetical protein
LRRYTCLVKRGCLDQIPNAFGLWKIEAAVYKCAEGEFAGLGKSSSCAHGAVETVAENDGRAVAGNLDDILSGVRMGCGEPGDHDFIDELRIVIKQLGESGTTRPEFGWECENGLGDGNRLQA